MNLVAREMEKSANLRWASRGGVRGKHFGLLWRVKAGGSPMLLHRRFKHHIQSIGAIGFRLGDLRER